MDLDLFQARMLVALADKVKKMNTYTASMTEVASSRMALGDTKDPSQKTCERIAGGVDRKSIGILLTAFWEHYADELELYPSSTRLLVNPPLGIDPQAENAITILTQSHLGGSYGGKIQCIEDTSLFSSTFEDVVIFWGIDIDVYLNWILECILPGTTVTLAIPSEHHRFWLTWANYDLGIDCLFNQLSSRYSIDPVHQTPRRNVLTEVFGLSPK